MSKRFNPQQWLNRPAKPSAIPQPSRTIPFQPSAFSGQQSEVEELVSSIERSHTDITAGYENWLKIGFALADGFGEGGRDFFYRISRFNADYSAPECDRQFSNCLKANKQGITLKSFFHFAKEAGITLPRTPAPVAATKPEKVPKQEVKTQTFPAAIYDTLPAILQRAAGAGTSAEEKDILLLGSLATLSVCFPNVTGIYDDKLVRSNLFLFVTAKASAGKGRLAFCRQLVEPIHKQMREQSRLLRGEYEQELAAYNAIKKKEDKGEKPAKPPERMLFIPANNSSSGVFQLLSDNNGTGLIFETEGDTLAQAFKSDYGNYSDGFRKAFHHESISYFRRTDREHVEMDTPCLSAVLSGTPGQVATLIPSAENGLFSRFMFYFMNVTSPFKDVFIRREGDGLHNYFAGIGEDVFGFYNAIKASRGIRFSLTPDQESQFLTYFREAQNTYLALLGEDYMATIRRLGLITFRIAMLLSTLRLFDTGEMPEYLICEDEDYQTAQAIAQVLIRHAAKVFSELPEDPKPLRRSTLKEQFLEVLPMQFSRQQFLQIAGTLAIGEKTAERYISHFVAAGQLSRLARDRYEKPAGDIVEEIEDFKE